MVVQVVFQPHMKTCKLTCNNQVILFICLLSIPRQRWNTRLVHLLAAKTEQSSFKANKTSTSELLSFIFVFTVKRLGNALSSSHCSKIVPFRKAVALVPDFGCSTFFSVFTKSTKCAPSQWSLRCFCFFRLRYINEKVSE